MEKKQTEMEKLKELYESVMAHPYRVNSDAKAKENYRELLYTLSHQIWETLKGKNADPIYRKYAMAVNMTHDFNAAIGYLRYGTNYVPHIENCLQSVKNFIDTGVFSEYYTNYHGTSAKYVFDVADEKYHGICSIAELDRGIAKYQGFIDKAYAVSEEEGKKTEQRYKVYVDYYVAEKEWNLKRLERGEK